MSNDRQQHQVLMPRVRCARIPFSDFLTPITLDSGGWKQLSPRFIQEGLYICVFAFEKELQAEREREGGVKTRSGR